MACLTPNVTINETNGLSFTLEWDLNDEWSVQSVTGLRTTETNNPFDFDGSDQVFINIIQFRETEDITQELQLNYSSDNVNAVQGFHCLDGDFENTGVTVQTPFLRLPTSHVKDTLRDDRKEKSTSVYANVDFNVSGFILGGYDRGRTWGLTVADEMN